MVNMLSFDNQQGLGLLAIIVTVMALKHVPVCRLICLLS